MYFTSGSGSGVFYLTREGYPYRIFAEAHRQLVATATTMDRGDAASQLLTEYLGAAVFATRRKLFSIFKLLLSAEEIANSIDSMITRGVAELMRVPRDEIIVYRGR